MMTCISVSQLASPNSVHSKMFWGWIIVSSEIIIFSDSAESGDATVLPGLRWATAPSFLPRAHSFVFTRSSVRNNEKENEMKAIKPWRIHCKNYLAIAAALQASASNYPEHAPLVKQCNYQQDGVITSARLGQRGPGRPAFFWFINLSEAGANSRGGCSWIIVGRSPPKSTSVTAVQQNTF